MKQFLFQKFLLPFIALCIVTGANAQFQYVSPLPNSEFNKRETNIIFGSEVALDVSAFLSKKNFSIKGSVSGKHDFQIISVEDGQKVLLKPLLPFAFAETVTVTVGEGLRAINGNAISGVSFSFRIEQEYTKEEKAIIAEQMKAVYGIDNPQSPEQKKVKDKPGFPDFTINTNTNPASGHVFFSHFNIFNPLIDRHYCIIASNGDSVYGKNDHDLYNNFELNNNGYLTLYQEVDSFFVMLDSNYYPVDTFQMGNGYKSDVHEFVILPDGSHWMICYDAQIIDMTVYDPSYNKKTTVIGCVIQKLDANHNVVFQWRSWDHFSIIDGEHTSFASGFIDAVHANAIEIESDGNILLSSRHMCEITKINTATGAIIWRLGGKNNQFTFINDTEAPQFHYQHDIRRLPNGNITLFDNGNFHSPAVSYAKEYTLSETTKTATLVWSYKRTVGSGDVYSIAMGSMQRLPNGNSFICWGLNLAQDDNPSITEVDVNKNIVWEMTVATQDAVYRANRHEWNPCARPTSIAIKVKNITSSEAKIDWEPSTNAASYDLQYRKSNKTTWKEKNTTNSNKKIKNLASNQEYVFRVRSNCANGISSGWTPIDTFYTLPQKLLMNETYTEPLQLDVAPNPFAGNFIIGFNLMQESVVKIEIFDITGRIINTVQSMFLAGFHTMDFDLKDIPQGIYFVKLVSNEGEVVKKVIKE